MGFFVGLTLSTTHFNHNSYGAIGVSLAELSDTEFDKMWKDKNSDLIQVLGLLDIGMREQHLTEIVNLTPREKEVVEWLTVGLRPDQIADRLSIGYRTVDKYIDSAKRKLNARTRDQAVAKALILNVIDP